MPETKLAGPVTERSSQRAVSPSEVTPEALPQTGLSLAGGLARPSRLTPATVLQLQRHVGNRAVTHLVRGGPVVQTKLTVGPVGDRFEQEADRVARQVVEGPPPVQRHSEEEDATAAPEGPIRRQPDGHSHAEEGEEVQRSPLPGALSAAPLVVQRHHGIRKPSEPVEEEDEEEGQEVQRSAVRRDGGFTADHDFTKQLHTSMGRGHPLRGDVRRHLEPRMGADFGNVRVHTGPDAVQMSRDIHAEAFTHGSHIYFGDNKFQPGSKQGQRLLAHELTHVVQQTGGGVQRKVAPRIQRKWRTPAQWYKDRQAKKAEKKAGLDTVDYDSLQGIKKGQVLPEVGKMAERRMKDMMKYDEIVVGDEAFNRMGEDALRMIDDESLMAEVLEAVLNNPDNQQSIKKYKIPAPTKEDVTALAEIVHRIFTAFDPAQAKSGGLGSWIKGQIPGTVDRYTQKAWLADEFGSRVSAYSRERAKYSAKGLRPEGKYEGLPGMTQVETFIEERKNVQFEQVTVAPGDIPRWAAAIKQMDAVKALLEPDSAPPVDDAVGWRGGGSLGDKFDWVKDVRKKKIVGPLATYLDNKHASSTKIFGRLAEVDALMRRIVEPEMLGRVPVPTFHISTRGAQTFTNPFGLRASAARGEVNIAYNEDMPTIAHEVGHIVEEYLPMDDWADIHMLLSERHKAAGGGTRAAKGENIFTRNEGRYKGKYVTSKYTSRAYSKDNAEVLSMWMQFMAKPEDALKLIDGDPQHAALILRTMRPADYAKTAALRPFDIYLPNPTGEEGPLARYKKAQEKTQALFKM